MTRAFWEEVERVLRAEIAARPARNYRGMCWAMGVVVAGPARDWQLFFDARDVLRAHEPAEHEAWPYWWPLTPGDAERFRVLRLLQEGAA